LKQAERDIKELVIEAIRGDKKSQKGLYDHFAPKMLALCYRYLNNKQDVFDVFQEGFLKVFSNLDQLKDADAIEWWMKKIFVNEALQFIREQRQFNMITDLNTIDNVTDDRANGALSKMGVDDISNLIKQLPEGRRVILNLYIIEGYSHHEIAEMLGISVGTSKSQLHDARNFLKLRITGKD
jgi:RNA polymerase sigma-70 factor (ECF subfamily)